jgi:hypothetical protein
VTRAIARELTDEARLHAAMTKRERLRWRADLHEVLEAAVTGDHSVLELAHPEENRWKDKARDNAAAAARQQSLRYGWAAVTQRPCATAAEVIEVLRHHGWRGRPRPCSPGCPVERE